MCSGVPAPSPASGAGLGSTTLKPHSPSAKRPTMFEDAPRVAELHRGHVGFADHVPANEVVRDLHPVRVARAVRNEGRAPTDEVTQRAQPARLHGDDAEISADRVVLEVGVLRRAGLRIAQRGVLGPRRRNGAGEARPGPSAAGCAAAAAQHRDAAADGRRVDDDGERADGSEVASDAVIGDGLADTRCWVSSRGPERHRRRRGRRRRCGRLPARADRRWGRPG